MKKQNFLGYLFLIPSLIAFAIFMFWPMAYTFYLSSFDWNLISPHKKFVGFANYIRFFTDPLTWKIMKNAALYIVILGGISGVSKEVIEVAKLDGISNFRIFRDIIVPMSSATGIYVLITTIVQGLQYVYTPIKVITQGGPNYASSNLIYMSYHYGFTLYQTGMSAASAVVTIFIFLILLILEFRFVEKGVYYEN